MRGLLEGNHGGRRLFGTLDEARRSRVEVQGKQSDDQARKQQFDDRSERQGSGRRRGSLDYPARNLAGQRGRR